MQAMFAESRAETSLYKWRVVSDRSGIFLSEVKCLVLIDLELSEFSHAPVGVDACLSQLCWEALGS